MKCRKCGTRFDPGSAFPRATPLAKKKIASLGPAVLVCSNCGHSTETRAQEWVDMSMSARTAVWLEFLLVQGFFVGQLVAFVATWAVQLIFGSDDFWGPFVTIWLVWAGCIVLMVSIGIRDSARRKPEAGESS